MKYSLALFFLVFSFLSANAQMSSKSIKGRVFNFKNNESVPFATVIIRNTTIGVNSDANGEFILPETEPGFYQLQVSAIGYKTYVSETFRVTNALGATLNVALEEESTEIAEITVRPSYFPKKEESPNSLRTIGIDEIEKNPGGNRDISKIIQSYPGVASSVSYRNDLIVRGGGPGENKFYLDDVEIPNLNHFGTQGASGGPTGIINVDFIKDVNFYSGAFPSSRGNALSSVLEFNQKEVSSEKFNFRTTLGASDLAFATEGKLSEKSTLLASVRRSYLEFLFKALELPFLPTYNDLQFKFKTRLSKKTELSIIGLGAIDQFSLNTSANKTEEQRFILGYLPDNDQWNYTIGAVLKHFNDKGSNTYVLSHNVLNNTSVKYQDNIEEADKKVLDYQSVESEFKFRFEHNYRSNSGYKINYGSDLQYANYTNKTYRKGYINGAPVEINYQSEVGLVKYALFGQVSHTFVEERLTLSAGIRGDGNSYSDKMSNPFKQLSPRFSANLKLTPSTSLNFNTGRFRQLPPFTTLGFRNNDNILINKENGLQMIGVNHFVAGIDFRPVDGIQLAAEGFLKKYDKYPFSIDEEVSLASKGVDYGAFGDEAVTSSSNGRSYGFELLARFKNFHGFYGIATYTFVRSEFSGLNGSFIPSSWDNRNIFSITATRKLGKDWDLGFKWRYLGGAPYTSWDMSTSTLKSAWDAKGRGYLDYKKFNQGRLSAFHQLDLRIDKGYYLKNWSLMFYLDIQNVYNFKGEGPSELILQSDSNGQALTDPKDSNRYLLKTIPTTMGTILPTIGVMIEF